MECTPSLIQLRSQLKGGSEDEDVLLFTRLQTEVGLRYPIRLKTLCSAYAEGRI